MPSTNGRLTLSPSPVPLTPLDHEMSLVDPFEALRAYAKQDRSPLADISRPTEGDLVFNTETKMTERVAHPTTPPSIDEWDVALRALATGCIAFDYLQKSPLLDSLPPNSNIGGGTTSNFFPDHGLGADCPQFASSRTNARMPPLSNERPHDHTREFHIWLAATSLGRERLPVRVPAGVDLGYLRFREELKRSLTDKGDECIWRGLEMQDKPRLWAIEVDEVESLTESELMDGAN